MKKLIYFLVVGIILSSCTMQTALKKDTYKTLYAEKPTSILVLPPINKSTKVEAKDLFYSSIVAPLTQRGYYVLPPLLTMAILKEENAYDSELFENNSMKQVGELFGADAVLFTTIHEWKKISVLATIEVTIEYTLKSTKTDEVLFHRIGTITLDQSSNSGSGSLLGMAVGMALDAATTAMTDEIVVGRKCNYYTLSDMPAGKYSEQYNLDGESSSSSESFKVTISQ